MENQEELLERELSIEFFGDSKQFEKSYRSAVCKMFEEYGEYEEKLEGAFHVREKELILLGEHNIEANPSYIYLKGSGEFLLGNGNTIKTTGDCPIALASMTADKIEKAVVRSVEIMTIENLTSFHRMRNENVFYIFLSGYHNMAKQRFIRKLAEDNSELPWYHFGDLDPDGYFILEHLKKGTGIPFQAFQMDRMYLKKYRNYGKKLEENDCKKAHSLLERGLYCEEISYMLKENIKLEQEVISWKERNC